MQTIVVVLGGLLITWLMGYPLTYFVFQKRDRYLSNDAVHALSFFVGYAIIVSFELIFVGFDIPVMFTAFPLLLCLILANVVLARKGVVVFHKPSRLFIIGGLLVVLVSGFSLFTEGVTYYKGYAWWDTLYYGSHADFLKTTPLSQLGDLVFDNPYLGPSYYYFEGAHRIGRGVYQAFMASVFFIDGASTLGYMNVFGILLVYCGVVYLVDGFGFSLNRVILMAFAASIVPNVIITQLEGFIPIGLFSAFTLIIVRISLDYFKLHSKRSGILVGLLFASFISTLLDGLYIVVGMYVLSLVVALFIKRIRLRQFPLVFIAPLVTLVFLLPYREQFAVELSKSMLRSGLNFIYAFAYSPGGLNWIFWGRTLVHPIIPNFLYLVMTFLSIAFLFASFVGVFMILYQQKRPEGLTMLLVMLMPFVFWSFKDGSEVLDLRYSLFKLLTFAVPIIVISLYTFFDLVLVWAKTAWQQERERWHKLSYRFLYHFLQFCVYGLVLVFVISSVERESVPQRMESLREAGIADRFGTLLQFNDDESIAIYNKLQVKDQNILLVSGAVDLGFWWSVYYGRNNHLFMLSNETYKTYIRKQPDIDLKTIPLDAQIVYTPSNANNAMVDSDNQSEVAFVLKTMHDGKQCIYIQRTDSFEADKFSFLIFAKEAHTARITMHIQGNGGETVAILFGDDEIEITDDGDYEFVVDVQPGSQEKQFEFINDNTLTISNVRYSK